MQSILDFNIYYDLKFIFIAIMEKLFMDDLQNNKCHIHGGNFAFSQINQNILNNIFDYVKALNILDLFYMIASDDIDINTSKYNVANLADTVRKNHTNDTVVKLYLEYIKIIICKHMKWKTQECTIRLQLSDTEDKGVFTLSTCNVLVNNTLNGGEIYTIHLYDISGNSSYVHNDGSLLNILQLDYIYMINSVYRKNIYVKSPTKRLLRINLIINLFLNGYIDFAKSHKYVENTYWQNSLSEAILQIREYTKEYMESGGAIYMESSGAIYNKTKKNDIDMKYINDFIYLNINDVGNKNISFTKGNKYFTSNYKIDTFKIIENIIEYYKNNKSQYIFEDLNIHNRVKNITDETDIIASYNSELSRLPNALTVIKLFTDIKGGLYDYEKFNKYIIDSIYMKGIYDSTLSDYNSQLYEIATNINLNKKKKLNKEFYVYRYENLINTGKYGIYNNLKKDDVFIVPFMYSTTLKSKFVSNSIIKGKKVFLEIKLKMSDPFILTLNNSSVLNEDEITIPFGTKLKVIDTRNIIINNEIFLYVMTEYDGIDNDVIDTFPGINITEKFINYYKQYLNDGIPKHYNPIKLITDTELENINNIIYIETNTDMTTYSEIITNNSEYNILQFDSCTNKTICSSDWNGTHGNINDFCILSINCLNKKRDFDCLCSLLGKINNVLLCDVIFINGIEFTETELNGIIHLNIDNDLKYYKIIKKDNKYYCVFSLYYMTDDIFTYNYGFRISLYMAYQKVNIYNIINNDLFDINTEHSEHNILVGVNKNSTTISDDFERYYTKIENIDNGGNILTTIIKLKCNYYVSVVEYNNVLQLYNESYSIKIMRIELPKILHDLKTVTLLFSNKPTGQTHDIMCVSTIDIYCNNINNALFFPLVDKNIPIKCVELLLKYLKSIHVDKLIIKYSSPYFQHRNMIFDRINTIAVNNNINMRITDEN